MLFSTFRLLTFECGGTNFTGGSRSSPVEEFRVCRYPSLLTMNIPPSRPNPVASFAFADSITRPSSLGLAGAGLAPCLGGAGRATGARTDAELLPSIAIDAVNPPGQPAFDSACALPP